MHEDKIGSNTQISSGILLIVDDEKEILSVFKHSLMNEPYQIKTATSGEEALEILTTEPVSVLLTDIMMPGMNGIELIKRARRLRPFSLQTVIITGHASMETAIEAMRMGASDYLLKPVENAVLTKTVAAAFKRAQLAINTQQIVNDVREKSVSIFEKVQAGIMLVDEETFEIIDINPAACTMIGAEIDELIGTLCYRTVCASGIDGCPLVDVDEEVTNAEQKLTTRAGLQRPILKSMCKIHSEGRVLRLATFMDMSEQEQLKARLSASQKTFHSIVEKSLDGIFVIDSEGVTRFANKAGCQLFGLSIEEMMGQPFGCPMVPFETTEIDIVNHKSGSITAEMRVADSEWQGEQAYVVTLRDISDRKMQESHIKSLANFDQLTGIPNRRLLLDRLNISLSRARRNAGKVAVLYIDLDHFKPINDDHGHDHGDEALKVTASRLNSAVRSTDTVARVGGDEFVLIMGEVKAQEDILNVVRKIITLVNEPILFAEKKHQVGCSVGISLYPQDGTTHFELIKKADAAMYHVKENGRNSYAFFTHDI